jgi:hypothetical protein
MPRFAMNSKCIPMHNNHTLFLNHIISNAFMTNIIMINIFRENTYYENDIGE